MSGGRETPGSDGSRPADDGQRQCIGGVLTHARNRQLLDEWLTPSYDVVTPDPNEEAFRAPVECADLLVLDAGAYERYGDWVAEYRASEASAFRPVLLLAAGDEAERLPDVWERVDDVVSIPVEKAVLDARIRGLLSRRALSRELAASERRFRELFEAGPDPAIVVDQSGLVLDGNAAFRSLVDFQPDECSGRALSSFDAFDQAAVDALQSLATDGQSDGRTVVTYRTRSGETRYAECSGSDLSTERGEPARQRGNQVVILRDVTERVEHERELQRQVDRLDEFAGVLAHEMRNPLGIATGWLDVAATTGEADAFARVEGAHDRIDAMIDELLQLARQGRIIGDRTRVSLAPIVTDSWAAVDTTDATLDVDTSVTDCTAAGDRGRLQDLFANLFRNAVEHGGSDVTVEVGVLEDRDGVYVSDDGPGLDGTDRDRLFESGYTMSAEGTGFGLAIVRQIADAHDWSVRATDAPDGGARFEFTGMALSAGELRDGPSDSTSSSGAGDDSAWPVTATDGDGLELEADATGMGPTQSLPASGADEVLDTLPLEIAVVDGDGVIVATNKSWRAFGLANGNRQAADSVGDNYLAVTEAAAADDDHARRAAEGIRTVLDGDRDRFTLEYPCHSPDEQRWFLLYATSFTHGGRRYATLTHVDVTDRKLAELSAQQRVEELSLERDRLALLNQVVRHDIRNDLSVVLGWGEQLGDHVDPAGEDAVDRVLGAATHANELTRSIRDLTEVLGAEEPTLTAVSVSEVIRDEVERVRANFENRSTDVTITGVDELPASADVLATSLLSSVFGNLLDNAVFHNDASAVVVDVSVDVTEDTVVVRVADNGPGIPDSRKQAVFGRGEKGLDSPGSGLGLYLVDQLVETYGGSAWVEDSESGGAVFCVSLRRA